MQEKTFNRPSAGLTPADESSRDDARVIDHEQVPTAEPGWQVADCGMRDGVCAAVEHEQPRRAALSGRRLRDEIAGKVEVEAGDVHD